MKLVLLRHGQSTYNLEKKFCGWTDVPLTQKGILEAKQAGIILKNNNFKFDVAYTSVLKRAKDTLKYVLEELNADIKVYEDWHLNERCYGALQGKTHKEMINKYGSKQVHIYRRSYDVKPPSLSKEDIRYAGNDIIYKGLKNLPLTESLEDTLKRTVYYFNSVIKPNIKQGKNILIVAHGNSLRSLVKYLENLTSEEIVNFEFETGIPYVYEIDENMNIFNKYFLRG